MKKILLSVILLFFVCGCTKEINEQGQATWKLDPVRSEKVEKQVESAAGLLTALTPFLPHAGVAATALLTALGVYRTKVKPNFDKARTEANLYHTTTHTLVQVIETIKKDEPELWAKIEPFMDSKIGKNTENVIRAMRGLPVKE